MHRAAGGFRTGLEPTGDAAKLYPLKNYANEDEWATAVLEPLSEEHKALCTEVHLKEVDKVPCSRSCSGGCRHCVFWKAVMYWRSVETGGNVGSQVELQD